MSLLTFQAGKSLSEQVFFVAFCPAKRPNWWMRTLLKKDFSHCMMLCQLGAGAGVLEFCGYAILQQYYHWIDKPEDPLDAEAVAMVWARNGWKVVKLVRRIDENKTINPLLNPFMTCVTLSKCLMGVSCAAQTPYQLYRWMLRNGGKEISGGLHG